MITSILLILTFTAGIATHRHFHRDHELNLFADAIIKLVEYPTHLVVLLYRSLTAKAESKEPASESPNTIPALEVKKVG